MADYQRARDKEEDTSVTSLVEAAPRIKVHSIKILIKTITKEVLLSQVHTLETAESCTHEVAVPPGFEFTGLREPTRWGIFSME